MKLEVQGVSVEKEGRAILDRVDMRLHENELVGVLGPNGAGKSTLLRVLAGLELPSGGSIHLDGQSIDTMDASERARMVGYLPQKTPVSWPLSVERVVALGRLPHGDHTQGNASIERAMEMTETADLRDRSISTLSGGERMRVLVARLLAVESPVLLVDEPIAALDPHFQLEFMELFRSQAHAGRGVMLVMHDLTLASRFCDRVVLLSDGQVAGDGLPGAVLTESLLRESYGVEVQAGTIGGERYVLPWRLR